LGAPRTSRTKVKATSDRIDHGFIRASLTATHRIRAARA
jgi:hypothetical protein